MVAAIEKALPCGRDIRIGTLQRFPRRAVSERHGESGHESNVVSFLVLLDIVEQVDLRVLLPFRVEALAGDVGPNRRQQLDAESSDRRLKNSHGDEDGDDRPVARQPRNGAEASHAGHSASACNWQSTRRLATWLNETVWCMEKAASYKPDWLASIVAHPPCGASWRQHSSPPLCAVPRGQSGDDSAVGRDDVP
jgi:hypothetical protein